MKVSDKTWKNMVKTGALELGVQLSQAQLDQLSRHASELLTWNRAFNITAITDP